MARLDETVRPLGNPESNDSVPTGISLGKRSAIAYKHAPWLLASGDLVALATPAVVVLQVSLASGKLAGPVSYINVFCAVALWYVFSISLRLYDVSLASSIRRTHRATLCAALLVFATKHLYAVPGETHLGMKYLAACSAVVAFGLWRSAFAWFASAKSVSQRVLIIGAGSAGSALSSALNRRWRSGKAAVEPVGLVDDDPAKFGTLCGGGLVLGSSRNVRELVEHYDVDILAIAISGKQGLSVDVFNAILGARERGVRVVSMASLFERSERKVALTHINHHWGITFTLEDIGDAFGYSVISRTLDILSGLVGCAVVAIIAPVIFMANRFWNPGPLFYWQVRAGKGGDLFKIYKLRSMVVDAERGGAVWATDGDPRITKLGRLLRRTRLDELPQFWNVLKGEMSLIGPRPERPEFVEMLAEEIPFYRARHAIKPGLTGWAQVMYPYGSSSEDARAKLEYDLFYIKHRTISFDILILARSIVTVLTASGR